MNERPKDKDRQLIFFAYASRAPGQADDNAEAIKRGVLDYNAHQGHYVARTWEEYRQTAKISAELLQEINQCEAFACDLTTLNHNVLFELGYALAKGKKILVLLNEKMEGATQAYRDFILKDIRYTPFRNAQDIQIALQQRRFESSLLDQIAKVDVSTPPDMDVLYLHDSYASQPSLELAEFLAARKDRFRLTVDDDVVRQYQTQRWYVGMIFRHRIVLIHFVGEKYESARFENAKRAFYAGLAIGFGRHVLLVAPAKFPAPLDYAEIMITYESSTSLLGSVETWFDQVLPSDDTAPPTPLPDQALDLIKLGIGSDIAEGEERALMDYFVPTAAYYAAIKQQKVIIVGGKGTGKTALYYKLSSDFIKDPSFFLVRLRPEAEDLVEEARLGAKYKEESSRKTFFSAVWRLVIYSQLLNEVHERISMRPSQVEPTTAEKAVVLFCAMHAERLKLNFYNVIRNLILAHPAVELDDPKILEKLHQEYANPLVKTLKDYFAKTSTKYLKVVIVADNLDKNWESSPSLKDQAEMMLSLLEIENRIKSELFGKSGASIEVHEIVFLRKDIFDYISLISREPDKLHTLKHEINWDDYPQLLRTLIENRFRVILSLTTDEDVQGIWNRYFDHIGNRHPFDAIVSLVICRPRDIIYFVNSMFEGAVNNLRSKAGVSELRYALTNYHHYLDKLLIAETKAYHPRIEEIVDFINERAPMGPLEYSTLMRKLRQLGYSTPDGHSLVERLIERGHAIARDSFRDQILADKKELAQALVQRKWFFLRNKVRLISSRVLRQMELDKICNQSA
jgi:hypothetical protein